MPDDAGFTLTDAGKPRLLIDDGNLPRTAEALRDHLTQVPDLYDRNGPARVRRDASGHTTIEPLDQEMVVLLAHQVTEPYAIKTTKNQANEVNRTLPDRCARLYLALPDHGLRRMRGFAYAPLLAADGTITDGNGYHRATERLCVDVPTVAGRVPARPTARQASAALRTLRKLLRTFPFADAPRHRDGAGNEVVDLRQPPGDDETGALVALLTAIFRPSLDFAPGLMVHAPSVSGAGSGKGLLTRLIATIATGHEPEPITGGKDRDELEKRAGAIMLEGKPILFIDNLNGVTLKSDLLASALTAPVVSIRPLGESKTLRVEPGCFVAINGNGLVLSEDLVRRFLTVALDARIENAEARTFKGDLLADARARRADLLVAALTIWRWGLLPGRRRPDGQPLGGFDGWCAWVRDPLLALGCRDPVARIMENKQADPLRQDMAETFALWNEMHGSDLVSVAGLHDDVKQAFNPNGRPRQFLARAVARLVGTRAGGFVLTQDKGGRWSATLYALKPDGSPGPLL